jgi:hypothetical protein
MDQQDQLNQLLRTAGEVQPPAGYEEAFLHRLDRRIRAEARTSAAGGRGGWRASLEAIFRRPSVAWGAGLALAGLAAGYFLRPDVAPPLAAEQVRAAAPVVPGNSGAVAIPVAYDAAVRPAAVPVSGSGPVGVSPAEVPGKRRTVEQAEGIPGGDR